MYRKHFGQTPLPATWNGTAVDVAAALTKDGKILTLSVVNPTSEEIDVKLDAAGLTLAGSGTRWFIAGPNGEAHNSPGQARVIDIQHGATPAGTLKVPALSATLFELPLK
jgi:alpha-N-arabinofuranosidase